MNRVRLPELDEKAVELQPLHIAVRSNPIPIASEVFMKDARRVKRDLLEMTMVGCDGLECHGDPFEAHPFALKCHIFELYRLGKVDRNGPQLAYKQY